MGKSHPTGPWVIKGDGRSDANYPVSKELQFTNTSGVDVAGVGLDSNNILTIGGSRVPDPTWFPIRFSATLNAAIVTTKFHIFGHTGTIKAITEIHTTAGNDAGAVTGHITKDKDGTAPGAGTSVMSGTFNLKGTAVTRQVATLSTATDTNTNAPVIRYKSGDSLSFKLTGTATTAAGILIEVWVQPDTAVFETSWYNEAVTSTDQSFFIANRPYAINSIRFAHKTAETTDATSNVQVTIDTGTDAPGAGTDLLTNDGNAGFDLNATANTVQTGAFAATTMAVGNRLSVDFNSSNTEGAGGVVTVTFAAQANRFEVSYFLHDTNVTDDWVFDSIRDCELWDGRLLHSVAAGGASTANMEKTSGTTAASSGTALLATAWDLNATANTAQVLDPVTYANSRTSLFLFVSGERMSIDYANTEQSLVGVCMTFSFMNR